jgi:hypothetical protein
MNGAQLRKIRKDWGATLADVASALFPLRFIWIG